jgi:hypothetical protein
MLGVALASCSGDAPETIEVRVRGIEIDAASRPVVILEDEVRELGLPIWIGVEEAQAIAMEIQGVRLERPLTHDLFKNALETAGVSVDKIVIETLRDGTYYARIHLNVDGDAREVDARPSDAIALALRFRKPMYVMPALLHGDAAIDLRGVSSPATVAHEAGVTVQDVTPELATHFALAPGEGVLVADVDQRNGDGLRRGDIILEVDGVAVASAQDFRRCMRSLEREPRARFSVLRDGDRLGVDWVSPRR